MLYSADLASFFFYYYILLYHLYFMLHVEYREGEAQNNYYHYESKTRASNVSITGLTCQLIDGPWIVINFLPIRLQLSLFFLVSPHQTER